MCGSSNAGDKAAKAQAASDNQKQAQIAAGQSAIDSAFGSPQREADINSFQGATKQLLTNALNKQQTDAQRSTKFALARNGQTGGSVDVDQNARLASDYNDGLMKVTQAASAAGQRVRAADEQTRQSLTSLVQTGLDSNSAATQALSGMKSNIAAGQADIDPTAIGNIFSGLGDFYANSTAQKAYTDANKQTGALYGNAGAYRSV